MAAEIVHLQQHKTVAERLHVRPPLVLALDVVDQSELKLRPSWDALDLAWIRCRRQPVDGVLELDLAHVRVELQLLHVPRRAFRHLQVKELQARWLAAAPALSGRAEQPGNAIRIVFDGVQDVALRQAAGQQRADLPLERAARDDGLLGQRVADKGAVHRANRCKFRCTTDVQAALQPQDGTQIDLSSQCTLMLLFHAHHSCPP